METKSFRSNGKLLLTAEYLVLRGALALALPVKFGQSLTIKTQNSRGEGSINWHARAPEEAWFSTQMRLPDLDIAESTDMPKAAKLQMILLTLKQLKPDIFLKGKDYHVQTQLEFNPRWGLGSSSTLIANLAAWAAVDTYTLLNYSIGGSGYDIACALAKQALFYRLETMRPKVEHLSFRPPFVDKLYFIYLGQKQDSSGEVRNFNRLVEGKDLQSQIDEISAISRKAARTAIFSEFCEQLNRHEAIMSEILLKPPVKNQFPDFDGHLKSLGAWGGDFVLAMYNGPEKELKAYFEKKELKTVFGFDELVL